MPKINNCASKDRFKFTAIDEIEFLNLIKACLFCSPFRMTHQLNTKKHSPQMTRQESSPPNHSEYNCGTNYFSSDQLSPTRQLLQFPVPMASLFSVRLLQISVHRRRLRVSWNIISKFMEKYLHNRHQMK